MRIISLNAWGGQCWPSLSAWLREAGADILLLQEVTRAPQPSPAWLSYRDAFRSLDQRADLFADVSRRLPGHQAIFSPAARGTLQDESGRDVASEHGIAAWIAPHLAVTAIASGFVHGSYRADGWGEEPVPRTAQAFRIEGAGASLIVSHLHGLRDPAGKGDTPARRAQAEAMVALLQGLARPEEPMVLAGDLNLLPGSESFGIFARLGLTDLVTGRGHSDTRTSLYPKPQRYADYCLVTPDVPVAAFDVPARPEVSDHRPLVLEVTGGS
ncbi:endonuclease/exonuclease/phosphatase family protein [Pseudoroseicyclus tamaricis]|uniref:Endonuclease/exonuclease/phosphatase family protein n=1 Tax=Pseudoroseicyclus tamaricis TaxID=2705421 RepID=A0A6B2JS61_9RHOB|nr:endonuclease/exonuclease/phosphatase family protein [Pseudoroseicyclus tamaricis]NDV01048.1 endonuclease/exonuclease/phosphatase family protein [Pseudoroseicyclus tamaricis]